MPNVLIKNFNICKILSVAQDFSVTEVEYKQSGTLSPFDKCFWWITLSLQKARNSHVPFLYAPIARLFYSSFFAQNHCVKTQARTTPIISKF